MTRALPDNDWTRQLSVALSQVSDRLKSRLHAHSGTQSASTSSTAEGASSDPVDVLSPVHPLFKLVHRFSLTDFERDVLLLCAGVELDASFASLVADWNRASRMAIATDGGDVAAVATFALALACLEHPHWSALPPMAALRRWHLIHMPEDSGVTRAPLRVDERILHYLAGVHYFEPRLHGVFNRVVDVPALMPSHVVHVHAILRAWGPDVEVDKRSFIQLQGMEFAANRSVAAYAASQLGLRLMSVRARDLPALASEFVTLARMWEREAMLMESALLLQLSPDDSEDVFQRATSFATELTAMTLISTPRRLEIHGRPTFSIHVDAPSVADQVHLWRRSLDTASETLNGAVDRLAVQFRLDASSIQRAAAEALEETGGDLETRLWQSCQRQARLEFQDLAQYVPALADWDDLILPEPQKQILRTIVAQVRQRSLVSEQWGFARKSGRGLGIHALFTGPSGTGKTMAAEVLARHLQLDLQRIDLSSVVSKYIGETEKNLRRVFDVAEKGGCLLLFDEADALFGKRSEVRDSHDRYANIEVSYLLQKIESFRGLAVLTTNLKSSLDFAFARRLRFTVNFPFPEQPLRREIWLRIFPRETPTEGLDFDKLARLSLSGGHIRNLALNAAFLAADAGEPVRMSHLLVAAQAEYSKLEKPLSDAEVAGWR